MHTRIRIMCSVIVLLTLLTSAGLYGAEIVGTVRLEVKSTVDGSSQPSDFVPAEGTEPRPMLVFLHSWSNGLDVFDYAPWPELCKKRNWHLLMPDFRGANDNPQACGSKAARQDVLDAVDAVCKKYPVDEQRIYLAGTSGGGHMAMVMAAEAPERWRAVSAWVGISDLAAWHAESKAANRKYWKGIEGIVGGAPGSSPAVDRELHYRSPVHHIASAKDLALDLNAGVNDGYTGSVPIHHTLDVFNVIAKARGVQGIGPEAMRQLSERQLEAFADTEETVCDRKIYLRRHVGPCRVTIFEGGHEQLPEAAMAWFDEH